VRPRSILLLCTGAAFAIAVYAVLAPNALPQLRDAKRENAALQADVDKQRADNDALARDVAALKDNGAVGQATIEHAARTELGFVKKDELVVTGLPAELPAAPK
jgi:cell division protein FtsB